MSNIEQQGQYEQSQGTAQQSRRKRLIGWLADQGRRSPELFRRLALPMGLFAIVFFGFAWWAASAVWQEVWLNAAFTCQAVLLTVFYVNTILDRHQERRWSPLTQLITRRIRRKALYGTTGVVQIHQNYYYFLSRTVTGAAQTVEVIPYPEWVKFVQETATDIPSFLNQLERPRWAQLSEALKRMAADYMEIASLFGERLDSDTFPLLWTTQELAEEAAQHASYFAEGGEPHFHVYASVIAEGAANPVAFDQATMLHEKLRQVLRNNLALLGINAS